MADFTDLTIEQREGAWLGGSGLGPTIGVQSVAALTLNQQNGAEISSRLFSLPIDPFGASYGRGAERESYGVRWTSEPDLDTEITTELLTESERQLGIANDDVSLYPLEANLGHDTVAGTLIPDNRATYEDIARRALNLIGISLVVYAGDGLPFLSRKLPCEYRTLGKTIRQVLSDTILLTQPRTWGEGTTFCVDGRGLQVVAVPYVNSVIEDYQESLQEGAEVPEPELEEEGVPDEAGDTFETLDDATFTSTETSGTGDDLIQTTTEVRKEGGQIVYERETRRGYVPVLEGDPLWAIIYDALITHEYSSVCPSALVRTNEIVRQVRRNTPYWNITISPGVGMFGKIQEIEGFLPPLIDTSWREVNQVWQAEGWLRHRSEVSYELSAYLQDIFGNTVTTAYNRSSKSETHLPIGGGMWWHTAKTEITKDAPVFESLAASATDYDPIANYPTPQVDTRSWQDDQPPPTVSCGDVDERCEETPEERYLFEVQKRNAILFNQPDKKIFRLRCRGWMLAYRVGQVISGAFLAATVFNLQDKEPTTDLEFWVKHV